MLRNLKIKYLLWSFFIISKINSPKASYIFMNIPLEIQSIFNSNLFHILIFLSPPLYLRENCFWNFSSVSTSDEKKRSLSAPINELLAQGTFVTPELGKSSINQLSTVGRIICNLAPKFEARFEAVPRSCVSRLLRPVAPPTFDRDNTGR